MNSTKLNLLITPKILKQQVLKVWRRCDIHCAWLQKISCFPFEISVKSISAKDLLANFSEIQQAISILRQDSKKHGYLIIDKTISHRQLGEQNIPSAIVFNSEAIFLSYLNKTTEFLTFQTLAEASLRQHADLSTWLKQYPFKVVQYAKDWLQLLSVCHYFNENPRPDCYIRQLDIPGVDSKFIEQHKSILTELLSQILASEHYDAAITGV